MHCDSNHLPQRSAVHYRSAAVIVSYVVIKMTHFDDRLSETWTFIAQFWPVQVRLNQFENTKFSKHVTKEPRLSCDTSVSISGGGLSTSPTLEEISPTSNKAPCAGASGRPLGA